MRYVTLTGTATVMTLAHAYGVVVVVPRKLSY
jgi:hypothetical protein